MNDNLETTVDTTPAAEAPVDLGPPRLERRVDGQVWLVREGQPDVAVRVAQPFPWTAPDQYISLINHDDHEELLIEAAEGLDDASRQVLREAIEEASFLLEITEIKSIETEFEIRIWTVVTRQGTYKFQIKHDHWPEPLKRGGLVIEDIDGNLFFIRDPQALDPRSQRLLWAYAD